MLQFGNSWKRGRRGIANKSFVAVWHAADYKTNTDPEDLDEKYQAQMTAYKTAFREMTGEEAEARVYHIQI